MRNLTLLQQNFLNNNDSELYNNLKVFITDNGNTLDCQQLSNNGNVFACHNPNVGGAGGFTRGLLEILKYKEKKKITNVIFMDDDVEIEPESIRRTYALLSLMKEEYRNAFISGAMLCLDKKYLQHENGALWNQGKCKFVGRGIDLREFSNVVLNEADKKRDYAAWWYCCIPIEIIQYDNLPIPVFIHQDDTEYSLRNTETIITMNGIAIWHPVATHIRTSANEYYNLRNLLIVNSIYCPEYQKKQVRKKMFTNLLVALLRMRYNDMDLIYRALEDFCKGPEWLLNLDAVAYHKEIQQAGYQFSNMQARIKDKVIQDCSSLEKNSIRDRYKASQKKLWYILRIVSLNGWLLPGKKKQQIHYMNVHPFDLYRTKKVILYDDVSGSGIEVRRDFFKLFSFIWIYFKSLYLILCKYKKSKDAYNRMFSTLMNIEYWNRVLKIENK